LVKGYLEKKIGYKVYFSLQLDKSKSYFISLPKSIYKYTRFYFIERYILEFLNIKILYKRPTINKNFWGKMTKRQRTFLAFLLLPEIRFNNHKTSFTEEIIDLHHDYMFILFIFMVFIF